MTRKLTSDSPRRALLEALAFLIACVVIGAVLGDQYIPRLTNHAGYFLVAVDDKVEAPIATPKPRYTAFIVIDGLRMDSAETMASAQRLAHEGQCRKSDQGTYTISRPEYALLSTGLEVDRTGARNNENTAPLAAESVWQIARESGLRVAGSSHLPWFKQLFPNGFDRFTLAKSHEDNVFAVGDLYDINLFHPLYVDEAGHQHGGASTDYKEAVTRADREIGQLLDRLDLKRDLVILTADHGHRDAGGHGGAQPEIRNVLACFAGVNVAHREDRLYFDGRSTGPALALLLGLRFPKNMRAGDDGLDAIWQVMDENALNAPYLADRHRAVDHFRAENRVALEKMLDGPPGTWPRFYAREAGAQTNRALFIGAFALALLAVRLRKTYRAASAKGANGRSAALASSAWFALTLLVIWATHHVVLGDFDYTVINLKSRFLPRAFEIVLISGVIVGLVHYAVARNFARLVADCLTFIAVLLVVNVGHIFVYGWPLGFPLPGPAARYFPFFGAIAEVGYSVLTIGLVIVLAARSRGTDRARREEPAS